MQRAAGLRILVAVNLPWDKRLGAVRVYSELVEQWRAAGHTVTTLSLSEAFPGSNPSGAGFAVRQFLFAYKAARFVRRNAGTFDVVDAVIGSLSGSKARLRFRGLLVARSVGLYRLYQRVEEEAKQHWPPRPRGTLFGRILYGLLRLWSNRVSSRAVRDADIVNVPNEDEVACLRDEFGADRPIMIQPYGLTVEQRDALANAAAPADERLAAKTVSFVGMWAPRKGSYEWPAILRAVWRRIPDARFQFLGTMVPSEKVLADLGIQSSNRIESISQYSPPDLPKLLAGCAVGAFPSYVEGFGLGVLEQLAAGIPTVAFDTPGPREILQNQLSDLLVPLGDAEGLADAICRLLELDLAAYKDWSRRSAEITAGFNWSTIAADTIEEYRKRLNERKKILFIQPFSLGFAGGGGARILRTLLGAAPLPWHSVCCSPQHPKPWPNETHLPTRPSWGKIERSRLAMLPHMTKSIFATGFRRRLKEFCQRQQARAIHTIPHSGADFAQAHSVARELGVPFFISVHDDLAYTAAHERSPEKNRSAMRHAWLDADACFVISEALGREYAHRFGPRKYEIVTDGLSRLHTLRLTGSPEIFRIYFMGLFHLGYEKTFRAFLEGLRIFEQQNPGVTASMTCRCAHIRPHVWKDIRAVKILPYAEESEIQRDMEQADFLYMPMPFGEEHENFARYSVSTKMVTYLGSGLPILYHGPTTSAAYELLENRKAAITLTTLDPVVIGTLLNGISAQTREKVAENALGLARSEFMLADQTKKFWGTICHNLAPK